jgi:hypothetical protein
MAIKDTKSSGNLQEYCCNYNLVVRVTDKMANITKESKLQFELG